MGIHYPHLLWLFTETIVDEMAKIDARGVNHANHLPLDLQCRTDSLLLNVVSYVDEVYLNKKRRAPFGLFIPPVAAHNARYSDYSLLFGVLKNIKGLSEKLPRLVPCVWFRPTHLLRCYRLDNSLRCA